MARRFRGVYLTRSGRYHAVATGRPGESWHIGNWSTEREAAIAVDRVMLYFGRDDLELNLPRESRRLGPASPEEILHASRVATKRGASSQYLGVSRIRGSGYWQAYAHVTHDGSGSVVHLGDFEDEHNAAIARDRFVLGVRGKEAILNFPNGRLKPATARELLYWARRLKHEPKAGRYEGVTLKDQNTVVPWLANLWLNGKAVYLGAWKTAKQAAIAYDRAVRFYVGEDAFLNFPKLRGEYDPTSAEQLRAETNVRRKRKTSSRYIGVHWMKQNGAWGAVVAGKHEHKHLGSFDDETQAAIERDKEAIRILGENAKLNFHPETGEEVFGLRLRDLASYAPRGRPSRKRSS